MPVKFKRKLVGADGGKHPHLKDSGDFPNQFNPPHIAAGINLEKALMLLQSKPVTEFLGKHPTLEMVQREVKLLWDAVRTVRE